MFRIRFLRLTVNSLIVPLVFSFAITLVWDLRSVQAREGDLGVCLRLEILLQTDLRRDDAWLRARDQVRARYGQTELLGEGNFGQVHAGVMPQGVRTVGHVFLAGDPVAVKQAIRSRPEHMELVRWEAVVTHRLAVHDGKGYIPRAAYDIDADVLISEKINGSKLRDWAADRFHMSDSLSADYEEIKRQTLEIRDLFRRSGLVHGDLTPNNIMIEPTSDPRFPRGFRLRVIDFGSTAAVGGYPEPYLRRGLAFRECMLGFCSRNTERNGPAEFADDEESIRLVLRHVRDLLDL